MQISPLTSRSSLTPPMRSVATPPPPPAPPPASFFLTGPDGGFLGSVPADGSVLEVGRAPENQVVVPGVNVSRRHASVMVEDGELWVRDNGSTHGTTVAGRRLEPGWWHAVGTGEAIRFADTEVRSAPSELSPTPPVRMPLPPLPPVVSPPAALAVGGPVGATLALEELRRMASRDTVAPREQLVESLHRTTGLLEAGSGVVALAPGVPTLVLPDIHARREFLVKVLEHEVEGEKVYDLLRQGRLNLLCLGDGMHAEGRAKERWLEAEADSVASRPSAAMDREMVESLGTMHMVMELKSAFPEHFHYLRGNHDEMNNPDREYLKYARKVGESRLVRSWVEDHLGQDFLQEYARFEAAMPLAATGNGLVATHAAPGASLSREEIERRDERAFQTLAWTDNTSWEADGKERAVFQGNLEQLGSQEDHWLVGHRPVHNRLYRGQFDDRLVQVNAPGDYVVALVAADGRFDPSKDIFSLA